MINITQALRTYLIQKGIAHDKGDDKDQDWYYRDRCAGALREGKMSPADLAEVTTSKVTLKGTTTTTTTTPDQVFGGVLTETKGDQHFAKLAGKDFGNPDTPDMNSSIAKASLGWMRRFF